LQEIRVHFAARREARRKFEERRAAKAQSNSVGKEGQGSSDHGLDMPGDDEFDVSDDGWEAEEEYMRAAELAWDFEDKHPNRRVAPERDIDPMWFSNPVHTFTRATNGPAAAEFVKDINRRVVRPAPRQNQPFR
jgi:hypothetical protein